MIIETLKNLFNRDLKRLITEIEQYENESSIWKTSTQISNSGGNLCLHLIGNLNTYIGKELGNTGYERNRELEFSLKGIPKQKLISMIESTIEMLNQTLANLDENVLKAEYPILVFEQKTTTEYLLIHLSSHLAYHLGQINYHRRGLEN
ncbi:MAG: DinB family protein [Sphingobacteriaceae bacterium]|nr:DinB family protein [Sphingobacteriaceae bacterium]